MPGQNVPGEHGPAAGKGRKKVPIRNLRISEEVREKVVENKTHQPLGPEWRTTRHPGVAVRADSGTVEMSRWQPGLHEGTTVRVIFLVEEWREFTNAIKNGEFNA